MSSMPALRRVRVTQPSTVESRSAMSGLKPSMREEKPAAGTSAAMRTATRPPAMPWPV